MEKNIEDSIARVVMSKYLANYNGKPILFNMSGEELRDLFFDFNEETGEYEFALSPRFIELIDFSNIPVNNNVIEKSKIKIMKMGNKE